MGSAVSLLTPNIFLNHNETNILNSWPIDIKSKFYRRYLDDVCLLFYNENQVRSFLDYVNCKH